MQLITQHERRDCSVFILMETWLNNSFTEAAIQQSVLTTHCTNKIVAWSVMIQAGLCIYTNNKWCKNAVMVSSSCSLLVEFITEKCQAYDLPRDSTTMLSVMVYIPPGANTREV